MYEVSIDQRAREQIDALPPEGQSAWRELRTVLELSPWNGRPLFANAPDGVQTWAFGRHGMVYYLIDEKGAWKVAVLEVIWR